MFLPTRVAPTDRLILCMGADQTDLFRFPACTDATRGSACVRRSERTQDNDPSLVYVTVFFFSAHTAGSSWSNAGYLVASAAKAGLKDVSRQVYAFRFTALARHEARVW